MANNANNSLPVEIDPIRLTTVGATLEGEMPLKLMPRLHEFVSENEECVIISLHFGKDLQGRRRIWGSIQTQLILLCQRCLQPIEYKMDIQVNLAPVSTEAMANQLPEEYDPLMVSDKPLRLADIVEEELLLNMPIVARHEVGTCSVALSDI